MLPNEWSWKLEQDIKNEQAKNNARREIMNKLKVGDKICTSINMTTPMEISAFDYARLFTRFGKEV